MATLSAALQRLHITSPEPARLADFYARTYGMRVVESNGVWHCEAPEREVAFSAGAPNQLRYALFRFESAAAWLAFRERMADTLRAAVPNDGRVADDALALQDPDGNTLVFEPPAAPRGHSNADAPPAALQHFAFRTEQIATMLDFYEHTLGFVVSDKVVDDGGVLRACFLRANRLHHALALFNAPATCFDHQSFEAPDWARLQHWADRMGELRNTIVWGVGRHGPGNDVFFMVRDPDGNLAEISAEIETCADDRPAGQWPHEERTLNLWGKAIMRS
ncbi:VOC family protein [Hydrogenophaga sp.]|uniref:VOC family protein n=1 Tax=Hydrogenophaga sp. TaxID=1904254 RepID=UPI002723484E|nr:VOC family protein [Hydrogenophaga sp.]MDO9437632.1 VOC family protein [Hydrogenophaga sp.]